MKKRISILLCLIFIFQQTGFCQVAGQVDLGSTLAGMYAAGPDKYRPLHLRYLSYDGVSDRLRLFLDRGDAGKETPDIEDATRKLLGYFFVGISLPNESFWVNLRPDAPQEVVDDYLGLTDMGRVMLEADLQLKKDTARFTSPQTREGREYWSKLYKKAEEIYGKPADSIPTVTRPWIVPDEIIVREGRDSAYIHKATLKVMLEQDHLKNSAMYTFGDERSRQLNEYSSQLIRQTIIPRLNREINSAKRYAELRGAYYSLIMAYWFKRKFRHGKGPYDSLINTRALTGMTSQAKWSKDEYFNAYRTSFSEGEYDVKEAAITPGGQSFRRYFSGGISIGERELAAAAGSVSTARTIAPAVNDIEATVTGYPGNLRVETNGAPENAGAIVKSRIVSRSGASIQRDGGQRINEEIQRLRLRREAENRRRIRQARIYNELRDDFYARQQAASNPEPFTREAQQRLWEEAGQRSRSTETDGGDYASPAAQTADSARITDEVRKAAPGGIDFRVLPVTIMPSTDSLLTLIGPASAPGIGNLDSELKQIQRMLRLGNVPSGQRIKEYLACCNAKGELEPRIDAVIACVAEIMRIQEEQDAATEQVFKDLLVLLEAYRHS